MKLLLLLPAFVTGMIAIPGIAAPGVRPIPQEFQQEVAALRFLTGEVRLLTKTVNGRLLAWEGGRWLAQKGEAWQPIPGTTTVSPDAVAIPLDNTEIVTIQASAERVRQVLYQPDRVWVATGSELWEIDQRGSSRREVPGWQIHQVATGFGGNIVAATDRGLHRRDGRGNWIRLAVMDELGRDWAAGSVDGAASDARGRLWIATRAGLARQSGVGWRFFGPADGVPVTGFTGLSVGEGDELWAGTTDGVIHYESGEFHYREGPRWLPANHVLQVVAETASQRAWFATAKGLGIIERRPMTLAAKARHYEEEIDRYIRRTTFGYVAEARLREVGDRTGAEPVDTDNDGLWTAMYGAGECFAYAATGDPDALARAQRAFTALEFLQRVTQGSVPAPPTGFVARTIRSVELPDPNVGNPARDQRDRAEKDRQWKVLHPRWPTSADGRWFWKADTSSDELDGHFFFLPLYYDFCVTTEAARSPVRRMVQALGDHLLSHDFMLTDHDGNPTRWGVFSPRELNHNPQWWVERGLNSLSLLTYLTVAEHITGDVRFTRALRDLIDRHGYAQNLMATKVQQGVGSGNQSDDEMAVMCFYNLIRLTRDPRLREQARLGFYQYWCHEQPERNPFFHFAYASQGEDHWHTNAWRRFSLTPWDGWLEDSAGTLRGFPLDRVNWPHRNSHRLDLVRLPPQQASDLPDGRRAARGYGRDGRVLPVENRHFGQWNTDPWQLDYRGNGHVLAAGTVFLLPYYMGMYHGFVAKPVRARTRDEP